MKKDCISWFSTIAFSFLCCLCACTSNNDNKHFSDLQQWMTPNGKMKVLSTIGMIDDIVKQVGGEHIDSLALIKGELDPHSYQLVKGDDEKLRNANIIFYNGLGLEHGPSLLRHLQDNKDAVALGNELRKQHPQLIIHYQGQVDPHIWMDISLWAKTVPFIVEALGNKDPVHADTYSRNGEALIEVMQKNHREVKDLIYQVPEKKRFLVTSHDAFNYFGRAYLATQEEQRTGHWENRVAAPEGLAPDSQLSATDIQNIIDHLKRYNIHVLFPESNISTDSIRKILSAGKEKGLNLRIASTSLYADAMGGEGTPGDTYLKMIKYDAMTFVTSVMSEQ